VGHSFGGWTALAATGVEPRIRAVVALAPGGASRTKPGILPLKLTFAWGRDVPTLYLVAEDDVSLPLAGMYEIFDRTPATKQMAILRRADHAHFMDNVEEVHETVRAMTFPGELAWLPKEMRPMAELCSGEQAHLFVRGLTLCHMDAVLRRREEARRFLAGEMEAGLAARGVDAIVHKPANTVQSL
jgi:predicted dienelactone hydrolase